MNIYKGPWLLIDTFIFGILALFFGFLLDDAIMQYEEEENLYITIFMIFAQVFVNILVIYLVDLIYIKTFNRGSDETFGLTVFTVLLFIPQVQLYERSQILYRKITGFQTFHN